MLCPCGLKHEVDFDSHIRELVNRLYTVCTNPHRRLKFAQAHALWNKGIRKIQNKHRIIIHINSFVWMGFSNEPLVTDIEER